MKTLILILISFSAFAQVKQKPDTAKINAEHRKYLAAKAKLQAKQDSTFYVNDTTKQPAKPKDNDK